MIRLLLLTLVMTSLAVYAWRDWYRSLCGLILLISVIEHPDMPKTLFGVQGLNPWNLVFVVVLGAWVVGQVRERLVWDMPAPFVLLLLVYLGVVVVGFARMIQDRGPLASMSAAGLWSEYLINCIKWTLPGLLLFHGARSRERFLLGVACTLGIYVLLGIQVIKWMPLSTVLSGEELTARSLKVLGNEVGFHRVNLSMMLGGASWAVFATHVLPKRTAWRLGLLLLAVGLAYAQALTGGRTGYGTWAAVGMALCVLRWRRYLLLAPVAALSIVLLVPGAVERMMQGFDPDRVDRPVARGGYSHGGVDDYTVTAGRTLIWPYVIEKIGEAPAFGHGRLAMARTGLSARLKQELNESFPHPHNAYLEMLLDNGWFGLCLVLPFYFLVLGLATRLLLDSRSPVFLATGGATVALVLALLVAGVGSQTFYPREGAVGMWCMIGLMLRVWVERRRVLRRVRANAEAARRALLEKPAEVAAVPVSFLQRRRRRPARAGLDEFLWTKAA